MLTLLVAVLSLAAVLSLSGRFASHADVSPNAVLARAVTPFLRDGHILSLADAYPDPWDTVQLVGDGEPLDPWTWRALRSFDAGLSERLDGAQLLVFWREGAVARMVRFAAGERGMPWFTAGGTVPGEALWPRKQAVFSVTLTSGGNPYYLCRPLDAAVPV